MSSHSNQGSQFGRRKLTTGGLESLECRRPFAADFAAAVDVDASIPTAEVASGLDYQLVSANIQESLNIEVIQSTSVQVNSGELRIKAGTLGDTVRVSTEWGFIKVTHSAESGMPPKWFLPGQVNRILFEGSSNDDVFENHTNLPSTILGGLGNDVLQGGSANDLIVGGDGHDQIFGNGGKDYLYGDNTNPWLERGNDFVDGGAGNDSIFGGRGNDVLRGNAGHDHVYGNDGHDYLFGDDDMDMLYGQQGNDRLFGGRDFDQLFGGTGDDFISGDDGNDQAYGEDGQDRIYGGNHDDHIFGGRGNDALFGGNGHDNLYGQDQDDVLHGQDGPDILDGGNGTDRLYGGNGNDRLDGGAGHDYVDGGAGLNNYVEARRVALVVDQLTALRTTSNDNTLFNTRDEAYFVVTASDAEGNTSPVQRVTPENTDDYFGLHANQSERDIYVWDGVLNPGESVTLRVALAEQDNSTWQQAKAILGFMMAPWTTGTQTFGDDLIGTFEVTIENVSGELNYSWRDGHDSALTSSLQEQARLTAFGSGSRYDIQARIRDWPVSP